MRSRSFTCRRAAGFSLLLAVPCAATAQTDAPPVTPLFHSAVWNLSTNGIAWFYGYENPLDVQVNIPFGQYNFFTPSPPFRGQPTFFDPGVVPLAGMVTFPATSFLEWTLSTTRLRVTAADATSVVTNASMTFDTDRTYPFLTVSGNTTLTLDGGTYDIAQGVTIEPAAVVRLQNGSSTRP